MQDQLRFSRPVAAAARLGSAAPDCHRFINKRVLLTGQGEIVTTANGRECFMTSLRLLVRICPNLTILLPNGSDHILDECRLIADQFGVNSAIRFAAEATDLGRYDAILSIGTLARPELPWTVINSNGWLARVSSGSRNLAAATDLINPIGALCAACLGVAEVFKRLIRLNEARGQLFEGLSFSLHTYCCGDDDPGPSLPAELPLDLLLVGAGAIGNGVIHLLSQLPTNGRALIVDRQVFQEENLGTCLLIGPQDLGTSKATFAERLLAKRFQTLSFNEELRAFSHRLGPTLSYPRVIVTGLDNIEARHQAQALWPDLILDGAIGDFLCQVTRRQWDEDSACLLCLFRHPPGPSAEAVAVSATGLSHSRARQMDDMVTQNDVDAAPADQQEWLRQHIGQRICSVVSEGVARRISLEDLRQGFAPSVPFVAGLSACMAVAELVKTSDSTTALQTRFQFDALRGPAYGSMLPQERRHDCACVLRAGNITKWRQTRSPGNTL